MDQVQGHLAGSLGGAYLRELCLKSIAVNLPSDVHIRVQQLLPYLQPDDAVELLDLFVASHGPRMGICPYRLLLPRPRVLLLASHLRGKLLRICRQALPDTASRATRDALLHQISSAQAQTLLADPLEFGAFLCETGRYDDGMLILEQIHSTLSGNPSWHITDMSLDCVYRQLVASVTTGRVVAARRLAAQLTFLYSHGLGRASGLLSAAAAALARLHLLTENWPEAVQCLSAAVDVLPAAVPADLSAELSRLVAELLLSRGETPALLELAPQALGAACRQWGQLHPQTVAAVRMMTDFAMESGLSGVARDLSQITEVLTAEMFGDSSPMRQRIQLDRVLLAMRLSSGDAEEGTGSVAVPVPPGALPLPGDSCWLLDRTLSHCQWMDEQIQPLLGTQRGMQRAHQLSGQIMYDLGKAVRLCKELFGPSSLRLARLLTELGRQHFSLEMDDLLHPHEGGAAESEQLLHQALAIQASNGLSAHHRDTLVTRITLAGLYTYSSRQFLLEAERLLRAALSECYGGQRRRHLGLAEHCLRGLSKIYAQHEDAARVAAMDELLETVQTQRHRLSSQRVPAGGLAALLPRRPWTQDEMTRQLAAALRAVSTVAPPDGPTAAPPGQAGGSGV